MSTQPEKPHTAPLVKDEMPTGSIGGYKQDVGKPEFHLLPKAIWFLAELFTFGRGKYGYNNIRKGMLWSRLFSAAMRHAFKWWLWGEKKDQEGTHHLIAAAWNLMMLYEFEEIHPELDDRTSGPAYVEQVIVKGKVISETYPNKEKK